MYISQVLTQLFTSAVKRLLLVGIQKSDYFRFTESGQLMPAIQT